MKAFISGLAGALVLSAGAFAQQAPFNSAGVTMGHWQIASQDIEANKKIFVAMGGKPLPRGNEAIQFPGVIVNLTMRGGPGKGGTVGSIVNHVGFIVKNVQEQTAQWKAAGVPVLPGNNGRLDQAYVVTPDGVRIEILEDKTQPMPIRHEHIHFFLTEAEVPKAQAWYAKIFGGEAGTRGDAPVVNFPGAQFRFNKADKPQAPTAGRVFDHFGFDIKDLRGFVKKLEAEGIHMEEDIRKTPTGLAVTFFTDPWGTRIELVQRPE